jgi:hypothetical protein
MFEKRYVMGLNGDYEALVKEITCGDGSVIRCEIVTKLFHGLTKYRGYIWLDDNMIHKSKYYLTVKEVMEWSEKYLV